jgi:hypothetical protein
MLKKKCPKFPWRKIWVTNVQGLVITSRGFNHSSFSYELGIPVVIRPPGTSNCRTNEREMRKISRNE